MRADAEGRWEWQRSVTPIQPPSEAIPHTSDMVYAGIVTGAWAGVLSLLVYGIGRLAGVPFDVIAPTESGLGFVPWPLPLFVPLIAGVLGGLLASLALSRRQARRLVFWIGTLVSVLTLSSPLIQPSTVAWSTRICLSVMHVITWFLVVPQIARIAGDSEPGAVALPRSPS